MENFDAYQHQSYWKTIWLQYQRHRIGVASLAIVFVFCVVGLFAPFLASSKPLFVVYNGTPYFPLFRYLFYNGFFTKLLDIYFNLMMFTVPLMFLCAYVFRNHHSVLWKSIVGCFLLQIALFTWLLIDPVKDPSSDASLNEKRQEWLAHHPYPNWNDELRFMNPYAQLNLVLRYQLRQQHQQTLESLLGTSQIPSSLWEMNAEFIQNDLKRQREILNSSSSGEMKKMAQAKINYIQDKQQWLEEQSHHLKFELLPPIRHYHWEDDAGGSQQLNQQLPWWELTRINRKDLVAALIFGTRISLVVGLLAVGLALLIGVPVGALAGYYGGTFDIIVSRMLEIWESMPTFFMLLMVVAITQSKSIFLVIATIGIFGWTGFSRYIRGEFFKQRNLPYVEACKAIGYRNPAIIFSHILPNAIPPLLTLLPFAIMGAITSEAGLSFLGLGEEGSCSWGVLMDEGRTAFPGESYLLWPPAIILTTLLVAIALVGDALRDALDPKMR